MKHNFILILFHFFLVNFSFAEKTSFSMLSPKNLYRSASHSKQRSFNNTSLNDLIKTYLNQDLKESLKNPAQCSYDLKFEFHDMDIALKETSLEFSKIDPHFFDTEGDFYSRLAFHRLMGRSNIFKDTHKLLLLDTFKDKALIMKNLYYSFYFLGIEANLSKILNKDIMNISNNIKNIISEPDKKKLNKVISKLYNIQNQYIRDQKDHREYLAETIENSKNNINIQIINLPHPNKSDKITDKGFFEKVKKEYMEMKIRSSLIMEGKEIKNFMAKNRKKIKKKKALFALTDNSKGFNFDNATFLTPDIFSFLDRIERDNQLVEEHLRNRLELIVNGYNETIDDYLKFANDNKKLRNALRKNLKDLEVNNVVPEEMIPNIKHLTENYFKINQIEHEFYIYKSLLDYLLVNPDIDEVLDEYNKTGVIPVKFFL